MLGEHIGQAFTIVWMVLLGLALLRQGRLPRWLPWVGFVAAGVYAMAQGELLATAIPGFPVWDTAGLAGSLLWLGWLIALGIVLLRQGRSVGDGNAR
jgi:Flp pilus assembly protein protease CpaA